MLVLEAPLHKGRHGRSGILTLEMNRFLKTFFLWLLIAVLPVQGFASAIEASCGSQHHGSVALKAVTAEHHHDGVAGAQHHHEQTADSSGSSAHASTLGKVGDSGHKHSLCGACATCCVGAVAPPSALAVPPSLSNTLPAVVTPPALATGFVPAGLERPPKRFLA